MPKRFLIIIAALFASSVATLYGQEKAPEPYGATPSERQLQWHQMGMYCMVCLGLNTFTDQEWGYGDVDPALFNPAHFDADQVVSTAKAAGFKGLLLVAKHHDGFCLWPTKTTDYNITKSPWKKGKGDIVKAFADACRKYSLQFGIYCSPWDRHSSYYGTQRYIEIYRQQLKELYTNYGPLFMTWFDGANRGDGYYGGARETRSVDKDSYYGWDTTFALVRELQPSAVIFGDKGDIRWVGNEGGMVGDTSWATFINGEPDNHYHQLSTGIRNGQSWMPAECDVPLRPGWFYHASEDKKVKTPEQLMNIYLKSVGRGAGLDLGLAPDKNGSLSPGDVASLTTFGKLLEQTFKVNLAKGAKLTASNIRAHDPESFGPANITDNDPYSYWATDDNITTPSVILDMQQQVRFNIIGIRENIKLGQRVESFAVDAWKNGEWQQIAEASSIGNLRLIRLPHYISSSKVRLRITRSPVCPAISEFGLYAEGVR